jgi:preprotein translocase subunit SecG
VHVVVSEGMELIIVLLVIIANLIGLVLIQRWSGLT